MVEGAMNHTTALGRSAFQACEILKIAAMRLRPGCTERPSADVRPGETKDLMPRSDQFRNDRRTDKTGGAGEKYTHRQGPFRVAEGFGWWHSVAGGKNADQRLDAPDDSLVQPHTGQPQKQGPSNSPLTPTTKAIDPWRHRVMSDPKARSAATKNGRDKTMRFGIFYEHQLPRPWNPGDEAKLFHDALEQVVLADKLGFDYAWEVEHHFLEEYSHSSAPEVFLSACAALTKTIRVGHGIRQVIPNYNHPARVAEGLATLDIISTWLARAKAAFTAGRACEVDWAAFLIPSIMVGRSSGNRCAMVISLSMLPAWP